LLPKTGERGGLYGGREVQQIALTEEGINKAEKKLLEWTISTPKGHENTFII